MKKRNLIFIAAMILAACAPPVESLSPTATARPVKTPSATQTPLSGSQLGVPEEALKGVTIQVWHPWFDVEASLFNSLVEEFNQKNEWGIKVEPASQVNYSYLYETVSASLPTPNHPNLVIALPEQAQAWNDERVVSDLAPYVSDPKYGIEANDFPNIFWTQDALGDARLAVPAQRTARFLIWNETWAKSLGFDAPPETPEDFQLQACRAHQSMLADQSAKNDGRGGWLVDTSWQTALSWMLAFEGGVLEQNDYRFLTPNNIAAFKYLRQLSEQGCAWQAPADVDAYLAFANREALFATASLEDLSGQMRAFSDAGNSDKWTVIPFPGLKRPALVAYGSSYVILKSEKEKELAAWLFVRWMLEPQQDARMAEATHLFPLRSSTLDLLADYKRTHPQWAQAVNLIPELTLQPQLASWRNVKIMLGDGFAQMYRMNIPSGQIATVLAQMEATSRDLSK